VHDLVTLLDVLGVTRPVHVAGNSFGGTVALALAMTHPDRVASLLLIEAGVVYEDWVEQLDGQLARGRQLKGADLLALRAQHGRKAYRFYTTVDALVNGTTLVADLHATPFFSHDDLRSIDCPVVAAYGGNSEILHHAHILRRLLPKFDLRIVPHCSHSLLAEAPSVVRTVQSQWLTSCVMTERTPVEKASAR
jgi:pimeloyl-ACP methyl ester carboxylesterase